MKFIAKLLLILTATTIFSCSEKEKDEHYISEFQGTWTGEYTGIDDNGTWVLQVHPSGKISGIISSQLLNSEFEVTGEVKKNGSVNVASGSVSSGAVFTGNMSENVANGEWTFSLYNLSGEWTGTKN
ncbi:hypothetical protein J2X69_004125 [Algoriphagus sp. 4150]|uniref:hypothetical protein n=1 Tax=Algoriphagus sp. 4150 TaxID=2817756 RepID=UPI002864A007|nr:hypothetical protein [Algoriphagus sp. 4150]MDR7131760.1 hypothetical protein [Algoriphagus sp. 4150]